MANYTIDLSFSATTAERNAWATLRPKIRAHVVKLLPIWRRANHQQKQWLRAHCPVLDQVVDIVEALGLEP